MQDEVPVMHLILNPLSWLLLPFTAIYRTIVVIRNRLFDTGVLPSVEFNIPVICLGNISVGGTGKTPHTEYLLDLLSAEYTIAVLSRGYLRKTKGFLEVFTHSVPSEVGDEPIQIKRKFPSVNVCVDADRVAGIRRIMETFPETKLIILDDAYQHRYVKPGLTILLVDINRRITHDFVLPAGRLREPAYEKRRADIILYTKCREEIKPIDRRILIQEMDPSPLQKIYFSGFGYGDLLPVYPGLVPALPLAKFSKMNAQILLVTGIANPAPLIGFLTPLAGQLMPLRFPDHHFFSEHDMLRIIREFDRIKSQPKFILTTEKDAVRLQNFPEVDDDIRQKMYFLPVKIRFLDQDAKAFNHQILSYVRDFERNRSVSAFAHHP